LTSLLAFSPQTGHLTLTHESILARGDNASLFILYSSSFGNSRGKSLSFKGTVPHLGQCIKGIGSPQYL